MGPLNDRALRLRPEGSYTVLNAGVISAGVEKPEQLMAAIDLMYDSEFHFQVIWGPKGLVSSIDADGNYDTMRKAPEGYDTVESYTRSFSWAGLPGAMEYTDKHARLLSSDDRLQQYEMAEKFGGHWINEVMIYGFQTVDEAATLNGYSADIQKYVDQKFAEWVTGECSVEEEWDAYKAQLEKLHVNEYVEAYQAYYDRIMGK